MDAKEQKKRYGVTMAPIPCTEAWSRAMPFDHKKCQTISFILIDRYKNTRTHVNIYDGITGAGYNANKAIHPLIEAELAVKLRLGKDNAYTRCRIADCPAAIPATPPANWEGEPITEPALDAPPPALPTRKRKTPASDTPKPTETKEDAAEAIENILEIGQQIEELTGGDRLRGSSLIINTKI